jgi:uncharacterized membrane protein
LRKVSDVAVPLGLIALSFVPVLAGAVRLADLANGISTPETARFFTAPSPVVVHIVAATLFSLLGALQFAPGLRRTYPSWHRLSGRFAVPAGIVAALSGLWMSHVYVLPPTDGSALYAMRIGVGCWMTVCLVLGFLAIRQRKIGVHRRWMLRGYAIGMGAGTQVLTTLPYVIAVGTPDTGTRAVLMGAGWAINAALAEWLIARAAPGPQSLTEAKESS